MGDVSITSVSRRTSIEPDGTVLELRLVKFRTAKGVNDEVRVSLDASNEQIREVVRDRAAVLDDLVGPV